VAALAVLAVLQNGCQNIYCAHIFTKLAIQEAVEAWFGNFF
jgi:hypothetical protein